MANRFDQYVRTQYVPSALEYMQMGISNAEQDQSQQLAQLGMAYETAFNVDAAFDNDRQVRDEILGNIRNQVDDLVKNKDLSSPQAMAQYRRLISDRKNIDQLAAVHGNAQDYNRLMGEFQNYRKEYGNDYNVTPIMAQMKEYGASGKEGVRRGAFAGVTVDKYVDVVKEIQGVLKEVDADVQDIEVKNGRYWVRTKNESIPLDKLMANAGLQLQDPKYQKQIKNILFHNAYTTGEGDIQKGYRTYRDAAIRSADEQISSIENYLAKLPKDKQYDKDREAVTNQLKSLRDRKGTLQKLTEDQYDDFYANQYMENMALMAAKPFEKRNISVTHKADEFDLIDYRGRWQRRLQEERDEKLKQMLVPPSNIPMLTVSGSALQNANKAASVFNRDFKDLEIDEANNIPKFEVNIASQGRDRDDRNLAYGMAGTGWVGVTNRNDTSKWNKFIDFAEDHGKYIDREKVKKGDKNELHKLASIFKQFQASNSQDKLASLGVSLSGMGISNEQVAQYVNAMIGPGQNVVEQINEDGTITKVKASDIFPKDDKGNVKSIVNDDISATISPVNNKLIVSIKNGPSFMVNPDLETQRRIAPLSELFNSANKIGDAMGFVSYNGYNGQFAMERDLFIKKKETDKPEEAAQAVAQKMGTRSINPEMFKGMRNNEVYVFSRNKNSGRLEMLKYSDFNKNKEGYSARMLNDDRTYIMKKDGKYVALAADSNLNAEDLTNRVVQTLFDPLSQGPLSGMRDMQSPMSNRKFMEWELQQSMYPNMLREY
jgi:hypothetical protein